MQIVTLLALCCRCIQLSVYARFRAEIGGRGVGDWGRRFCKKKEKFYDFVDGLFFFIKKPFDAVDKILNILGVDRGDGTAQGPVPYDDIVNLVCVGATPCGRPVDR